MKKFGVEGVLADQFFAVMAEAEKRRQGVAWKFFSRDGKTASRAEGRFIDEALTFEEAKEQGVQVCLFPENVWSGADA